MCGASSAQRDLSQEQLDFFKELHGQAQQNFSRFNNLVNGLTAKWQPILDAGIHQAGFSAAQKANLSTIATEHVAANYTKAREATANSIAGAGGGDAVLPSGANASLIANVENAAAGETSDLESRIEEQDAALGRENYMAASNAIAGVAGMNDPSRIAGAVDDSGRAANDTLTAIEQADNAWMAPVFGAIGGVGATMAGKIKFGGSSSNG